MSTRETINALTETGKNVLALLRDSVLVALFGMLVISPAFIGERLALAGFEEGEMMGFKWKNKAETYGAAANELKVKLEEAVRTINRQKKQLTAATDELNKVKSSLNDPAQIASLEETVSKNVSVQQRASASKSRAVRTLTRTQPTLADAKSSVLGGVTEAIVLGSDRSLEAAKHEANKAANLGFPSVGIYLRKGVYATLSLPETGADKYLAVAKRHMRSDSYKIDFTRFCPSTEVEEGFTRCAGV